MNLSANKLLTVERGLRKVVIVVDNGTGFCKAGLAGDSAPSVEFPSVVGRPRYTPVVAGLHYRSLYVGCEAQAKRGMLSLSYPIRHGIVHDWPDLEALWDHTFAHLLGVEPNQHPIIVSEAPKNPLRNREAMLEILFERFGFPSAFVAIQAVLALYTTGRTTGIVLDSGDGVSHTVPVYEGYALHHAILRMEFAGRTLTDHLTALLTERGYYFTTSAEREIVRDMKEQLCFVSNNFHEDLRAHAKEERYFDETYIMPDGQTITLGSERFRCPEVLFRPELLNFEGPGIQHALYDSAMQCDVDVRKDLLSNTVLSGGSTMFSGIVERTKRELQSICSCPVRVLAPPERRYAVWLGGSILGSLSTFRDICVTRAEYEDFGARIVHRKCF